MTSMNIMRSFADKIGLGYFLILFRCEVQTDMGRSSICNWVF